ncbi:MAG: NAD(P)H-hydrate dehydratase [Eubacteriales bacterium]
MECAELNADILAGLPKRGRDTNKGDYGRLGVIAGSARYRGAASLALLSALRCGAGIVTLFSTERVVSAAAAKLYECTFEPLAESAGGGISASAAGDILTAARSCDVLLCGCGMGNTSDTAEIVVSLIENFQAQLIFDADALNALAACGRVGMLSECNIPPIITPHIGEMSRLCGMEIADIKRDRAAAADAFSRRFNCIVVLKDDITHIAFGGEVYVSRHGCAGLARGGSGDTLAGIMAAFAAQCGRGISILDAAKCAVVLHGLAAERAAARRSMYAMLPSELSAEFGDIFLELKL